MILRVEYAFAFRMQGRIARRVSVVICVAFGIFWRFWWELTIVAGGSGTVANCIIMIGFSGFRIISFPVYGRWAWKASLCN